MSCDKDQERKESPFMEKLRDNVQKHAYISKKIQLQSHSVTFIQNNKSLLSATSVLFRSPMAYNFTATLDNLTCTDYVDFGKCQDRFGQFSWSKTIPTTWMLNSKYSRKMTIKSFDCSKT